MYRLIVFCAIFSIFPLFSTETKQFAKEQNQVAQSLLKSLFADETLYQEAENFDADSAAQSTDHQTLPPLEQKLQEAIESPLRAEPCEGSEPFLLPLQTIMESKERVIGLDVYLSTPIPEEQKIEHCIEGGSFLHTVEEERHLTLTPEKFETLFLCDGHKENKSFYWRSDAEQQIKKWEEQFSKNSTIAKGESTIEGGGPLTHYKAVRKWTHTQNFHCNKGHTEKRRIQEEKVVDHWKSDPLQQKILGKLESHIQCELLQIQEYHPGYRTIDGRSFHRDSWNRRLLFSCKGEENSPCQLLRDRGGVLLKRNCLETDEAGHCLIWEKSYDMGGKAAYSRPNLSFEEEPLFNLEEHDLSYERNQEFGQVISTLATLENLGENIAQEGFHPSTASIFSGNCSKCRRSFDSKILFDCCYTKEKEGSGLCIKAGLGGCSQEEIDLFEKNREGKCHYIGFIKHLLQTEHLYCCFPSKLARIVQEEGRKQLGLSWGNAQEPNCKGFTLSQLQSLDFEKMDFSEFLEEIESKIDRQKLAKTLKKNIQGISQKFSQESVRTKTEEKVALSKQENAQ